MTKLLLLLMATIVADSWPGFLGAGADVSKNTKLPTKWTPQENVAWTTMIPGHGQSSPVVWGDRVFVTSVEGPLKDQCHVLAIQLADGKTLWKYTLSNSDPVENSLYVSRAAPTPVVDADRIYTFFESGDTVALDHQGKEVWKRSINQDYGKFQNKFGLSASLVQNGTHIFILVDDEGPSYLLALDKKTGETTWKQERTPRASWSSPGMVKVEGGEHIVVSSAGAVEGYDPATGKLLWSYTDIGGNTGTTPIDMGDGKFFVAASGGRDGKNSEIAKKSNGMMQIVRNGNGWEAKMLWLAAEATPSWASPIAHQGCAYWVNTQGVIFCFDVQSGKLHYKQRSKQSCWATPIGIGDRVYFFGKEGITTVLAAGPEYKVIAENDLWNPEDFKADEEAGAKEPTEERRRAAAMFSGPTIYGVAVTDNNFLIRIGDRLFCVRQK